MTTAGRGWAGRDQIWSAGCLQRGGGARDRLRCGGAAGLSPEADGGGAAPYRGQQGGGHLSSADSRDVSNRGQSEEAGRRG